MRFRIPLWAVAAVSLGMCATGCKSGEFSPTVETVKQGSIDPQHKLGYRYVHGELAEQDFAEAAKWITEATGGDADAQYDLGCRYGDGDIVVQDFAEAIRWFRKAAEQGNANAQYRLGWMYVDGDGVGKDTDEAVRWYTSAAEQGHVEAQIKLCILLEGKNDTEAFRWIQAAAETGNLTAQLKLGSMYYAQDPAEAVRWYIKVDEQGGTPKAQLSLGRMYGGGMGVEKDVAEAIIWLEAAAVQDYAKAQFMLGFMYAYEADAQDFVRAYMWFNRAAEELPYAKSARDALEKKMSKDDVAAAERREAAFKARENQQPPAEPGV